MIEIYNMGEGGAEFQIGGRESGGTTAETKPIKAQKLKDIRGRMQKPETPLRTQQSTLHQGSTAEAPKTSAFQIDPEAKTSFEPAPKPEAKKLSDAIADNPEHAASLLRGLDPESDEGKNLDKEANDLMAEIWEERRPREENESHHEPDEVKLEQLNSRLMNIFSGKEEPVTGDEQPAPIHPDDDPGKSDESTGEGGNIGGGEVPEAPIDENARPAPSNEEEELGTHEKELQEVIEAHVKGEMGDEEAQNKIKDLLNRLLGDKESLKKGWHVAKWAAYWTIITVAIAFIWNMKTVGGAVAKAGGRK